MTNILEENIRRHYADDNMINQFNKDRNIRLEESSLQIFSKMAELAPDLFGDELRHMPSPDMLSEKIADGIKEVVSAKSRLYNAVYTSEELAYGSESHEQELYSILAEELVAEIRKELSAYSPNVRYYPYVPIMAKIGIESERFIPEVRFKTRYGILDETDEEA